MSAGSFHPGSDINNILYTTLPTNVCVKDDKGELIPDPDSASGFKWTAFTAEDLLKQCLAQQPPFRIRDIIRFACATFQKGLSADVVLAWKGFLSYALDNMLGVTIAHNKFAFCLHDDVTCVNHGNVDRLAMLSYLAEKGMNLNARLPFLNCTDFIATNSESRKSWPTLLHIACYEHDEELVKFLLSRHDIDKNPIFTITLQDGNNPDVIVHCSLMTAFVHGIHVRHYHDDPIEKSVERSFNQKSRYILDMILIHAHCDLSLLRGLNKVSILDDFLAVVYLGQFYNDEPLVYSLKSMEGVEPRKPDSVWARDVEFDIIFNMWLPTLQAKGLSCTNSLPVQAWNRILTTCIQAEIARNDPKWADTYRHYRNKLLEGTGLLPLDEFSKEYKEAPICVDHGTPRAFSARMSYFGKRTEDLCDDDEESNRKAAEPGPSISSLKAPGNYISVVF